MRATSIRLVLIAFALLALGATESPFAQGVFPGFSLNIKSANDTVKVGEKVFLDITYRNITNAPLQTGMSRPAELAYDVQIKGPGGEEPAETEHGRRAHWKVPGHAPSWSEQSLTLSPGETFQQTIDVSGLYDMSQPGVYIISVSKTVYRSSDDVKAHKGVTVKSNTVQVTVTN